MANKIYDFIKENIKSIIFIIVFIIIINLKLPFSVYAPGGTIDISKRLNKDTNTSINMTYVSYIEGKTPVLLLSFLLPNWDIVKNSDIKYDNETIEDVNKRDRIYLYESLSNAMSIAYNYVGETLEIKETKYYITYISPLAKTDVKIGDEIISVDGYSFDENLVDTYLKKKKVGDIVKIEVKENNKIKKKKATLIENDGKILIGLSYSQVNEYSNAIDYKYKASEAGPSGGAMLTLALIDELSDNKMFTDKKICGTGTIEKDGSIGEIGGVKYKLLGAKKNKCDVFISPKENYEEALQVKKDNNLKIDLIKADNIEELLKKLSS